MRLLRRPPRARPSRGAIGALLGLLAAFLSPMNAWAQSLAEAEAEKRERATLLAQVLPEAIHARSSPAAAPILIGSGGLMAALGVGARSPLWVIGGLVPVAGGVGFYLVPEGQNYELLSAAAYSGVGLAWLGFPRSRSLDRYTLPLASGYLAAGSLLFLNFAYSTHPGKSRLVANYRRLRTPAARHGLSRAELQRIERDLYDTEPAIPKWMVGLPLIASGLIMVEPALDSDLSDTDRWLAAGLGAATAITGLGWTATPSVAGEYRKSLNNAGLWATMTLVPGGVGVIGGFD